MVGKGTRKKQPNQVDLEHLIMSNNTPAYITGNLIELRASTKEDKVRLSNLLHTLFSQAKYDKADTLAKLIKTVLEIKKYVNSTD